MSAQGYLKRAWCLMAYLNAFECETESLVGGVPVLDEGPESSPGRLNELAGPIFLPLLLRDANIDVGPRLMCWLDARLAEPFRRRRSSMPTWFWAGWSKFDEKFRASPRPMVGRPGPPPLW